MWLTLDTCRQLPYLVGNVVELLDLDPTAESLEEGANIDLDATRVGKSAVIKTSTRQTIFLPLIGLVDSDTLKPGDLIGVNKDSYLVLDTLPAEYDSRVKAMEVDEKPTEQYTDVGGLDKQIEELVEAIVWPMKEAERFKKIGIKAPKGTTGPRKETCEDDTLLDKFTMLTQNHDRRANVRTPRYRKDSNGQGLRGSDGSHVSQACWTSACSDVYRRWC
jgi:hypothetical protein